MAQENRGYHRSRPSAEGGYFNRFPNRRNKPPQTVKKPQPESETNDSQSVTKKEWSEAERIAIAGVTVNAILAIVTFMLFTLSKDSTKAAQDSAKAAITADSLSKVYNDSLLTLQNSVIQKADTTDSVKFSRDTATFNLQKKGLDAQIASVKQTQSETEKENEPFLEIKNIEKITLINNSPISLHFKVFNYGKFPVTITGEMDKINIVMAGDSEKTVKNIDFSKIVTKPFEAMVTKEVPYEEVFNSNLPIYDAIITAFRKKITVIIFYGKINYTDNINNERKEYNYVFTIRTKSDTETYTLPEIAKNFSIR